MNLIRNNLWSTREIYLYYAVFLESKPVVEQGDYQIVFGPLDQVYKEYSLRISRWLGRIMPTYLRIKFWRGDPYVCIALKDNEVVHVSYLARTRCHWEAALMDTRAYVVGPVLTRKDHRGKGLSPMVLKRFEASPMSQYGLYASIRTDNLNSQRAFSKAEFKRILKYSHDVRLGLNFIRLVERYD